MNISWRELAENLKEREYGLKGDIAIAAMIVLTGLLILLIFGGAVFAVLLLSIMVTVLITLAIQMIRD